MSREYRVVWEREPHQWPGVPAASQPRPSRRYSQHYASLQAAQRKAMRLEGRIAESKGHDREDPMCCDGSGWGDHECQTWGEWEDATTADWQPLRRLWIEAREVSGWGPA